MSTIAVFVCMLLAYLTPAHGQGLALQRPAAAHYDLVALRVEFQPDTSRFTTGDGTFAGPLFEEGLASTIDPLPHDAAYFEAHLEFLRHYVDRVSGGRTRVNTHLIPEIVRLGEAMEAYAPTGTDAQSDDELRKLARLVSDAWVTADAESGFSVEGLDPARTVYVIFHAGVGRDVELTGTTLDRTPGDLPSIFFGEAMLRRLLPDDRVHFKGRAVNHTIVMPRTETRQGFNFITEEPFLIELSINGMLAASFFNYLGVPDLFNTRDGSSAIGPYGLMDPLGIFAFNGLFPPEPTAWTKLYLGWAEPTELAGDDSARVSLRAASLYESMDMARAWISDVEYFLIENRFRDPEDDGVTLTIWRDGAYRQQRFENGSEGFNQLDVSAFEGGVVVAVDNYDWALPGGLDDRGGELNGGILIWHVDERVIAAGLDANVVNSDPTRRGVDVEEADSAQDLGFPNPNPFAPRADLGSPFDFWYRGNPIRVVNQFGQEIALYRNRFGPDTHPSSDSNDGGPSFVVLDDFSEPGAVMSFRYTREALAGVRRVDVSFSEQMVEAIGGRSVSRASFWSPESQSGLRGVVAEWRFTDGSWQHGLFDSAAPSFISPLSGESESVSLGNAASWAVRSEDGRLHAAVVGSIGEPPALHPLSPMPGASVVGHPVGTVSSPGEERVYYLLDEGGLAVVATLLENSVIRSEYVDVGVPLAIVSDGSGGFVLLGRRGAVRPATGERWELDLAGTTQVGSPVLGRDVAGMLGVVPLPSSGQMVFLEADGSGSRVDVGQFVASSDLEPAPHPLPILLDLDDDGHLDVVVAFGRHLLGFTRSGALTPGFPVQLPAAISAQPVAAYSVDEEMMLFLPLRNGSIHGMVRRNRSWHVLDGFPLAAGASVAGVSLVQQRQTGDNVENGGFRLLSLSETGSLSAWEIDAIQTTVWGTLHRDARRSGYVEVTGNGAPGAPSGRLLVASEVYNWPNPIREGWTFVRCMTAEDSEVVVTIVDGAGLLMDRLVMGTVHAGVPGEVRWETNSASGLYFARVTATSASGRSDTRMVKMAIIR